MKRRILAVCTFLGFNPVVLVRNLAGLPEYMRQYRQLKKQILTSGEFAVGSARPILTDKNEDGGTLKGHYFHQDLLVARKIFLHNPPRHIDIGSRTDGFVAHVASFREIEIFDIRELHSTVDNIKFVQADFMNLRPELINSADSVSCLHVIEHFGLGRYGDPIDFYGHVTGLENIYKILKKGAKFYFSTPIGPQRIEFNAQRVFSLAYLLQLFKDKYTIDTFSYVDDEGDLHADVKLTNELIGNSCGCFYGCGIFEMTRI